MSKTHASNMITTPTTSPPVGSQPRTDKNNSTAPIPKKMHANGKVTFFTLSLSASSRSRMASIALTKLARRAGRMALSKATPMPMAIAARNGILPSRRVLPWRSKKGYFNCDKPLPLQFATLSVTGRKFSRRPWTSHEAPTA